MSQGTIVVGALLFAFVFYLAANQKLGAYYAILTGAGGTTGSGSSNLINPVPSLGFPGVTN